MNSTRRLLELTRLPASAMAIVKGVNLRQSDLRLFAKGLQDVLLGDKAATSVQLHKEFAYIVMEDKKAIELAVVDCSRMMLMAYCDAEHFAKRQGYGEAYPVTGYYIEGVFVHKDYRGQGWGSSLYSQAHQKAKGLPIASSSNIGSMAVATWCSLARKNSDIYMVDSRGNQLEADFSGSEPVITIEGKAKRMSKWPDDQHFVWP